MRTLWHSRDPVLSSFHETSDLGDFKTFPHFSLICKVEILVPSSEGLNTSSASSPSTEAAVLGRCLPPFLASTQLQWRPLQSPAAPTARTEQASVWRSLWVAGE